MSTIGKSEVFDPKAKSKPYMIAGAGKLAASVWKKGSDEAGWRYRINLFRLSDNGRVGQLFEPADLYHLVKLTRVLATVLADDGCLLSEDRIQLLELVSILEYIDWMVDED